VTGTAKAASARVARAISRGVLWLALLAVTLLPGASLRGGPGGEAVEAPRAAEVVVPSDRRGVITARVTADGKPVSAARVSFAFVADEGSALAFEAKTDAGGVARGERLPRGAYWVIVDAEGFARAATTLALDEAESNREVALALAPEHTLAVKITDEMGGAVAGAELEALGQGALPSSARTDARGEATIRHLGAGPFAVTARAPGLEEVTRTGVAEGAPLAIVLRKLGALLVHVEGRGAGASRVEIIGGGLAASRAADTDAKGDLRIGGLGAGAYALRATRGDEVSDTELDVRLASGEERAVTLKLAPGAFARVHVVSEELPENRPVAGAAVVVAEDGLSPFPLEGVTDREGRVRLGPIARRPAAVSVTASGFVGQGGVALADASRELEIVLPRAGVIEGRVVDGRGFPIGGVSLVVVGTDRAGAPIDEDPRRASVRERFFSASLAGPSPLLPRGELGVVPGPVPPIPRGLGALAGALPSARTAKDAPPPEPWITQGDGTFKLAPVPPGRVRVIARHPQYVEAASELATLEPGGKVTLDVVLREGGVLEGIVEDARGRPEPRVKVTALATRSALERTTRSGDDGRFAFAALPEDVTILATADDGRSARVTVDVKDGARREIRIALPLPRDPIDVRVRDDRDFPLDAVQIAVGSLDPKTPLRLTVFTDARGEARIPGARGLPLRLTASRPSFATRSLSLTERAESPLKITLDRGQLLVGEVRGRHVGAIDGADVRIFGEEGAVRTSTNARGEFRLDGVRGGESRSVRIVVRAKGHAKTERVVTLPEDRRERGFDVGRIELAEECAVEGEVVDDRGAPIAGARVGEGRVPTWVPAGPLPAGLVQTDARGAFHLGELSEGTVTLEAYAVDRGRGRANAVRVSPGRPTTGVRIVLDKLGGASAAVDGPGTTTETAATGNVAVTLGATEDGAIVLVDVGDGTAAERAGLAAGDRLIAIDGATVTTLAGARARLAGPVQDDVVVAVARGERTITLRVPREPVRR